MATFSDNPSGAKVAGPDPPSSKLRWLLTGVCGALLALLLLSAVLAYHFLGELHAREMAVTRALSERTQMLAGLWLSIQDYNQAVQQFVAQAQDERDQATRQRLERLTVEIDGELRRYPGDRDSEESALLRGMQDVFTQQRVLYVAILTLRPEERRRRAESMAAGRAAATQKQILDWSGRLQSWSGERRQHVDRTLVAQFAEAQEGLTRALAIAFGSGLLLVLGSAVYIARLERQTRTRYLELARSQSELQQLSARLVDAQETERRSISRELHDEIGQALGALLVDIGRLTASLSNSDLKVTELLDHMKSVAERSLGAVRNIALLLRPSMLDDLGLAAALEWLGREVSRSSEVEVDVETGNVPEELPDEYGVCIYRVAQEALNNAVRHSGARNAKIRFEQPAGTILVRITDDGRGFDPGRTRGLGLLGMEERVKRLGGSLKVESQPGKGAAVIAELPFPRAAGGHA
jgi:signal transduction histidine kinase